MTGVGKQYFNEDRLNYASVEELEWLRCHAGSEMKWAYE
jgi:hypothetical protein